MLDFVRWMCTRCKTGYEVKGSEVFEDELLRVYCPKCRPSVEKEAPEPKRRRRGFLSKRYVCSEPSCGRSYCVLNGKSGEVAELGCQLHRSKIRSEIAKKRRRREAEKRKAAKEAALKRKAAKNLKKKEKRAAAKRKEREERERIEELTASLGKPNAQLARLIEVHNEGLERREDRESAPGKWMVSLDSGDRPAADAMRSRRRMSYRALFSYALRVLEVLDDPNIRITRKGPNGEDQEVVFL